MNKKLNRLPINNIYHSEAKKFLKHLPDNSIDSFVCDPPYELGFMGKKWDNSGIAYDVELWKEVLRVLKPGGHLLAFSGTRTYHRMAVAIEDAGFEIRDMIEWLYFSGFPKSMDISKQFDKMAGAEREVVGRNPNSRENCTKDNTLYESGTVGKTDYITKPASDLAKQYNGWGTALKPAHEPIVLARKPVSEKTVAENVEKWGTGGVNVDECRIGDKKFVQEASDYEPSKGIFSDVKRSAKEYEGRFPANCITLDENEFYSPYFNISPKELSKKASKKDRGEGNNHPTVKPIDLMAWLIKLVTPKDGIVCDIFAGSGSTLVAAKRDGYNFIGCDMTNDYVKIARTRLSEQLAPEEKPKIGGNKNDKKI